MNKYSLYFSNEFKRNYKSFKKRRDTQYKIDDVIVLIGKDPYSKGLKSHMVNLSKIGKCWSSRVDGDIRIIWTFSKKDTNIIIVLRVGGHDIVYS